MMSQYRDASLGELSPHVYAIAEQVRAQCLEWDPGDVRS